MTRTVTLQEADEDFARCVREVEAGTEFVITRDGQPVARLLPMVIGRRKLSPDQEAALARTEARMAKGWPLDAGPLDRDSLHER